MPLSGYLKFYIDGYMDGASSTASIEEAYHNERREVINGEADNLVKVGTQRLSKASGDAKRANCKAVGDLVTSAPYFIFIPKLKPLAPVVFAPNLMVIVVIGSSPSLLLCVGVWVGAMAVMTTFFSRV
ncbi:hypothetical protein Goari_003122 [Gossypium aridum]|uniref:Uncharacterized protein n=1 Tax=Gossypium aridum TaxID=34290 RepID=A0A7J8YBA0_GOSAI|nr:hypothetical protein [Gossypium aridum]